MAEPTFSLFQSTLWIFTGFISWLAVQVYLNKKEKGYKFVTIGDIFVALVLSVTGMVGVLGTVIAYVIFYHGNYELWKEEKN